MARRFRFSLQKILDVRSREEKEAELVLAAITGRCAAAERAIEALLLRRRDTFLARTGAGDNLALLAAHDAFRSRLGRDIETQQKELARLTVEREDKLALYVEARKRRDVLAKLAEKQAEAHRKAELKREALSLDDLNTGTYIRRMAMEEQLG